VMHWLAELDGRRVSVEVPASPARWAPATDCLGLALGITEDRPRGARLGPTRSAVRPKGRSTGSSDRTNHPSWASKPSSGHRGSIPGSRLADRMRNEIPMARGLGVGGDRRRARRQRALGDVRALQRRVRDPDSHALGGFTVAARFDEEGTDRSNLARRARSCARPFIPTCASRPSRCRRSRSPASRRRSRQHRPGRDRRRRPGDRAARPAPGAHGGPDPRAIPGVDLPAAAVPRRCGPRGRGDRSLPLGGRLVRHRVRQSD
jgi:hypothetical protein